jgi:hypothetical protein
MNVLATCFVKLPAVCLSNRTHKHWRALKDLADAQKSHTGAAVRSIPLVLQNDVRMALAKEPILVRFTVITVQKMDDDNLQSSVKYYRDEVARWLGVDDGDPRVKYVALWERYRGKSIRGVRIEFVRFLDHLLEAKLEIEKQISALSRSKP